MTRCRWGLFDPRGARFRRLLAAMALCCLAWAPAAGAASEAPAEPPPAGEATGTGPGSPAAPTPADGKTTDLTTLSLEQLLALEVIPINVLGSHTHLAGEWMVGYRYMFSRMEGDRIGKRRVSHEEVLQTYPVAHTDMDMRMHMLELMYAPSDRLSLMAMIPYVSMSMGHLNRAGVHYTTEAEGLGDISLMALRTFHGDVRQGARFLLNTGISLPTGSISQRDATPTNPNALLEYMMQLGSGTFDLFPGVTYLNETPRWALGAQAMATVRMGKNDRGYRRGNEHRLGAWAVYKVSDAVAPSVRVDYYRWGNVHGRDEEMNPATNAAFDPSLQKGRRWDLYLGVNLYAPRGRLKGHRLTLEAGRPIYQYLAGPQLETDWQFSAAWSYVFR